MNTGRKALDPLALVTDNDEGEPNKPEEEGPPLEVNTADQRRY